MEQTGVPGAAVAVVRGEGTLYSEGFGVRKSGESETVSPETVFQLASLSKPIGATVVASQMVGGKLAWDTKINKLMPDFALSDPWVTKHLTVGDLYAHRSGLPHAAGDDLEDIGYDRSYVLEHLREQPLAPFRANYNYANFGITAAAQAVSDQAGIDWATLSERQLYRPLGMASTSSRYSDFVARDNKATLHAYVDGKFQPLYERDADVQSPAGGVSSNVVDLGRWMSLVLGEGKLGDKEYVNPAALLEATTGKVVSGPSITPEMRPPMYGFGFGTGVQPTGRTTASHSGAFTLGAGTNFQVVPGLDLGIVALTNGGPTGAAESITAEFLDVVQFGKVTRDWVKDYGVAMAGYYKPAGDLADAKRPDPAKKSAPLKSFVGTYRNSYFGAAKVELEDGKLVVGLGPKNLYRFTLQPWDGDTFAFVPTGENAPNGSLSSATFGNGGKSMELQFFNENGLGTWTR